VRIGGSWVKIGGTLALLLLWTWISGCATLNPGPRRENFAPLFIYSEDEEREGKALDALGPFFSYRKDNREKKFVFRPLAYRKQEPQHYYLEYLYPLGKYEETDQEVKSYLMPFYSTRRDLTQPKVQKKERTFFLAIWGETDQGEKYGGLFPFYGHLKKRFRKDEMTFFLWPLYSKSREGENRTTTYLWPIFTLTEGGGREGWRVWPLAGHETKENDYEKKFFLWPFFIFEKRYIYTGDPTEIQMVVPFYVSMTSSRREHKGVLWPLFTYTYDQDDHYTQWDAPFPLVRWAKGDEKSLLQVFPFYRRKYWEGREQGYHLWPIHSYSRYGDKDYHKEDNRYLLFSKDEREVWEKKDQKERRLRVWPFFYYREGKEGDVYGYGPCLIPIDFEGFERNWAPIFSLYQYNRNPQGASESRILWGFYTHRQNTLRELYELSFLMTYYKKEDLSYFSLLKGLLEYRTGKEQCALRLLYSPWPIRWECAGEENKAVADWWSLVVNNNP
jgi:hypothetical protein